MTKFTTASSARAYLTNSDVSFTIEDLNEISDKTVIELANADRKANSELKSL